MHLLHFSLLPLVSSYKARPQASELDVLLLFTYLTEKLFLKNLSGLLAHDQLFDGRDVVIHVYSVHSMIFLHQVHLRELCRKRALVVESWRVNDRDLVENLRSLKIHRLVLFEVDGVGFGAEIEIFWKVH